MKKVKLQYLFLLLLGPLLGSCQTDEVNQIEVDPGAIVAEEQEILALELDKYTYYHNGEALTDATEILDVMGDAYSINQDGDKVEIYSTLEESPINFEELEKSLNIKPSSEEPITEEEAIIEEEAKILANETSARAGQPQVKFYTTKTQYIPRLRKNVRHLWYSNGGRNHYYGYRRTMSSDPRYRITNIKDKGVDTYVYNGYGSRRRAYLRVGIYIKSPTGRGAPFFHKDKYYSYTVYPKKEPFVLRYTEVGRRLGGSSKYRNHSFHATPNLHHASR